MQPLNNYVLFEKVENTSENTVNGFYVAQQNSTNEKLMKAIVLQDFEQNDDNVTISLKTNDVVYVLRNYALLIKDKQYVIESKYIVIKEN